MEMLSATRYGTVIKLKHVLSGKYLKALDELYPPPSRSSQHKIVLVDREDEDGTDWIVEGPYSTQLPLGKPVRAGATIRLRHVRTKRHLHSHFHVKYGWKTPWGGEEKQEVTAFTNQA